MIVPFTIQPTYTNHGIIYCTAGNYKNSAVVFKNGMILTTGLILLQVPNQSEVLNKLSEYQFLNVKDSASFKQLYQIDFRFIASSENGRLIETKAHISNIIHSTAIETAIAQKLSSLKFLLDGEYKLITEYSKYFASFILLQQNNHELTNEEIVTCFKTLVDNTSTEQNILDEVVCVSTPFGNEQFINSINYGHVANLLGKDNCLTLLNIPTAFGSEGGGVYDRQLILRSILLGSTFQHQNDGVCLPLAANVTEIFKVLFKEKLKRRNIIHNNVAITNSVCMVDSIGCWGTGCQFHMHGRYFVLTCSHVLSSENITCYSGGQSFGVELLFKNPIFDSAYDIALLEIPKGKQISRSKFYQLANYVPKAGQVVYSAGFPLFKSFAYGDDFSPSIYRGRVAMYSKGILITDCPVQAGQSGGPILDAQGKLLAVMVSNFKTSTDNRIYPYHNMCIPICDIYAIIEQYCKIGDVTVLQQLQAEKNIIDKWKLRKPVIESKV